MSNTTYTVIAVQGGELQRDLLVCGSRKQAIKMANELLTEQMRQYGYASRLEDESDVNWYKANESNLHAHSSYSPAYDIFIVNDEEDVTYVCGTDEPDDSSDTKRQDATTDKNLKKTDLTVNQVPVSVTFECPHCGKASTIEYKPFVEQYGLPSDWSTVTCPSCLKKFTVDRTEWD